MAASRPFCEHEPHQIPGCFKFVSNCCQVVTAVPFDVPAMMASYQYCDFSVHWGVGITQNTADGCLALAYWPRWWAGQVGGGGSSRQSVGDKS